MKAPVQASVWHCDVCGQTAPVMQVTPWEFRVLCPCDGWLSWAHHLPPPVFQGQGELFA